MPFFLYKRDKFFPYYPIVLQAESSLPELIVAVPLDLVAFLKEAVKKVLQGNLPPLQLFAVLVLHFHVDVLVFKEVVGIVQQHFVVRVVDAHGGQVDDPDVQGPADPLVDDLFLPAADAEAFFQVNLVKVHILVDHQADNFYDVIIAFF